MHIDWSAVASFVVGFVVKWLHGEFYKKGGD